MKKILVILLFFYLVVTLTKAESIEVITSLTPSTIHPGNEGYIQITVTNVGLTPIDKVSIQLLSIDSSLTPLTTFPSSLGGLESGKSLYAIFKFSVKSSTPPGFYVVKFLIKACSGGTCKEVVSYSIVPVETISRIEIKSLEPSSLKIGEEATLNLTLRNKGESEISDIIIIWNNPSIIPLGSSNRIIVDSLLPNEEIHLPIKVIVDPNTIPGIYPFNLMMMFTDKTGNQQVLNNTVGIKIEGDIDFIVTLESEENILPNSKGKINVRVANSGTENARFLTLHSYSKYATIDPKTIYIGTLDSDDYDTETLTLFLGNIQPGNYPLTLQLNFRDSYGNFYSKNYTLEFQVFSPLEVQKKKGTSISTILLIIFLFSTIYLIFKNFRRRKGR